jgi:signal transduction histidine kinase
MIGALLSLGGWAMALAAAGGVLALLREREQRLEAVARAAHELRGPLHAIGLGLALQAGPGSGRAEHRCAIELELARARLALDDLERSRERRSRRISGRSRPDLGPASLERLDALRLLEDVRRAAAPSALAAGVELQAEWVGEDAAIWGARLRIAQALGNLLANAIEHGRGPVLMRGRRAGHVVRFEVCDQGGGLPAPVAQLTRGARAGRGRRGRGLAIAAAIAAAHGGRLAGAPAQQGARLVLELPVSGSLSRPAAPWQPPVPEVGAGCSDHSTVGTGRRKVRLWRRASWSVVTARSLDSAGTPRSPNRGSAAIWSSRPR